MKEIFDERDEVQFYRLLVAIISTQQDLCLVSIAESMSITPCDVIRLMDKAQSRGVK